jgi:hypothetical protein
LLGDTRLKPLRPSLTPVWSRLVRPFASHF